MTGNMKYIYTLIFCVALSAYAEDQPNILWLSAEDISPHLGCYGDSQAITPNLDQLAKEGVRYTQVACGIAHTVLLKRDGTAVAFGGNVDDQCNVPEDGTTVDPAEVSRIGEPVGTPGQTPSSMESPAQRSTRRT